MLDFKRAAADEYAQLCRSDLSAVRRAGRRRRCSRSCAARPGRPALARDRQPRADRAAQARARGDRAVLRAGQGGFGSDHEDRTELPAIARRARRGAGRALPARGHGRHRRHAARHRVRAGRRRAVLRGHHRLVRRGGAERRGRGGRVARASCPRCLASAYASWPGSIRLARWKLKARSSPSLRGRRRARAAARSDRPRARARGCGPRTSCRTRRGRGVPAGPSCQAQRSNLSTSSPVCEPNSCGERVGLGRDEVHHDDVGVARDAERAVLVAQADEEPRRVDAALGREPDEAARRARARSSP